MRPKIQIAAISLALAFQPQLSFAHSGGLNKEGCHTIARPVITTVTAALQYHDLQMQRGQILRQRVQTPQMAVHMQIVQRLEPLVRRPSDAANQAMAHTLTGTVTESAVNKVIAGLRPNNSFKPTPLRGAA